VCGEVLRGCLILPKPLTPFSRRFFPHRNDTILSSETSFSGPYYNFDILCQSKASSLIEAPTITASSMTMNSNDSSESSSSLFPSQHSQPRRPLPDTRLDTINVDAAYKSKYPQLFEHTSTTLHVAESRYPRIRQLEQRPTARPIRLDTPFRLAGAVIYERGVVKEGNDRCTECIAGHGMFPKCVVLTGLAQNACASCKYKSMGMVCTLTTKRKFAGESESGPLKRRTIPIPEDDSSLYKVMDKGDGWEARLKDSLLQGLSFKEVWTRQRAVHRVFDEVLEVLSEE